MNRSVLDDSIIRDDELGYFYEAILVLAVRAIRPTLAHQIHVALPKVNVISDVVLPNAQSPELVLLSAYSEAESGTHMKFWRNVAEILEIRQHHFRIKVMNAVFPSNWKLGLLPLTAAITDQQCVIAPELSEPLRALAIEMRRDGVRVLARAITWLGHQRSPVVNEAVSQLRNDIRRCIASPSPVRRWKRYSNPPSTGVETRVLYRGDYLFKRGLVTLALLRERDLSEILGCRDIRDLSEETKTMAQRVGVLVREQSILKRLKYEDSVASVIVGVGPGKIRSVFERVRSLHGADEVELTSPIRGADHFSLASFLGHITRLHSQKARMCLWLVAAMKQWSRAHPGVRNLPLDLMYILGKHLDPTVSHRSVSKYANLPMIGGVSPLPRYLYGSAILPDNKVELIAEFFTGLYHARGRPQAAEVWNTLLAQVKDKLMKHKYVNYLHYLCVQRCEALGIRIMNEGTPGVAVGNRVADYCRLVLGQEVAAAVANSKFSFRGTDGANEYIFLAISAYDATHKHKEYPGRWRCACIDFDARGFRWGAQPWKCVVILDGMWKALYKNVELALSGFNLPGITLVSDVTSFMSEDFRDLT